MRKKKIETLESDIEELKKRLDEEIKKQKLSADRLMEELVSSIRDIEKRNGKEGSRPRVGAETTASAAGGSIGRQGISQARGRRAQLRNRSSEKAAERPAE